MFTTIYCRLCLQTHVSDLLLMIKFFFQKSTVVLLHVYKQTNNCCVCKLKTRLLLSGTSSLSPGLDTQWADVALSLVVIIPLCTDYTYPL